MKISFHGAAQTVTGSKHLIHLQNGKKILLDCGLFQGLGEDTLTLNSHFGFDAKAISHVILSHAHIDHSGLLPKLIKEGYQGKIYCTKATAELATILLQDSARIQEADVIFVNKRRSLQNLQPIQPLYTIEDAEAVFERFEPIPYHEQIQLDNEDISVFLTDAGHLLGSSVIHLSIQENDQTTCIVFSGDVGRYRDLILRSPEKFPQADYILLESTYGNSLHENYEDTETTLLKHITETCLTKKGKLIIPAFSVGRTQEIIFALNKLSMKGLLPQVPYFVDSPLSVKTTEVIKHHAELFNEKVQILMQQDKNPFDFDNLRFITEKVDSQALNERQEPMVIIASSGMAEAGRVKHHIANAIQNEHNTILMSGYCEYNSLGAKLLRGEKEVQIFRKKYAVKAKIAGMRSMSAHGDYEDLCQFISCQDASKVKKIFLVHGELDVQIDFKKRLVEHGFHDVEIPQRGDEFGL
jgi:metallo-beta-lactamase family protein